MIRARGLSFGALLAAAASGGAHAAAPTNAPQVLLAVTNSQSMDGTTSGAIMVGSGTQGAGLASSSSPVNFAVPAGFTPPINTGSSGQAPYTASCGTFLCDNGPSRMNLAKQAIKGALDAYGNYLNFGLYAFNANVPGLYTTWVYHMSPANGFTFVNTASANTVPNPCYQYTNSASATVKNNCGAIAPLYGGAATLGNFPYMQVSITSDNAQVNDVLYDSNANYASVFVNYQGPNPSSPYPPNYSLGNYNSGSVNISYRSVLPTGNPSNSGPTNAGYVPSTPQVMYAKRGFGYYATNYSSNTGQAVVAMGQPVSAFTSALSPQTSNPSSSEIKSLAGQSPIGGLLTGAKSYLAGLTRQACQQQFVVLLTDGLPTRDLNGKNWPPLGSTSAAGYGVYATFNADGTLASTNNVAVSDAISAVSNLAAAGIKTFVIGLGAGVDRNVNPAAADTLKAMAIAGGTTNFYPATDPASLNAAFLTIVDLIYKSSSIAAPVAPISVKSGNALEFSLTTDPSPRAGFVKAYAVDASGIPAATASWDAGASMSVANRTTLLRSTATDGTLQSLSAIDDAAFNLPPTGSRAACVPNADTVRSFVINPSYTQGSCTYLGDRRANWFLGSFSTQNVGRYIGPPATPALINAPGYGSYAVSSATRTPILMFSNNDGFLYGVDARSGDLLWGWTPRGVLAQMQNYTTFQTLQLMDGGLTVVDAKDASGAWGSYVIGSARSGAEHFSLKLGTDGVPTRVVYDTTVSSGYAPGDRAGATGSVPLHQSPQFLFVGDNTIAVYVVNVGTTSTLYEVNVATGASTSAALPFTLSSAIYVDPQFNRLWAGTSSGDIWRGALTGNAVTDVAAMTRTATMINPADNSTAAGAVLYVGYTEAKGVPYVYGITSSQMTVFALGPTGWKPVWATTPSSGYAYTTRYTANATLATMVMGSVVSDDIRVDGTTMIVPLFVPPTGCGLGSGYYAFFDLTSGKFPVNSMTYNGTAVTGALAVGEGAAFKLTSTVASSGNISLNGGTAGNAGAPSNPIKKPTKTQAPTNWKQQ